MLADRRSRPITPRWRTATWGYLRFHEGTAQPWPRYGPQALRSWVTRLADAWPDAADVYVYFNNDQGGAAVDQLGPVRPPRAAGRARRHPHAPGPASRTGARSRPAAAYRPENLSGSGPVRWFLFSSVISLTSAPDSSKSKMSMFSRSGPG